MPLSDAVPAALARRRFEALLDHLRATHYAGMPNLNVGWWSSEARDLAAAGHALVERLLAPVPAASDILDVACGGGGAAAALADRWPAARQFAVDRALSQLERRRRASPAPAALAAMDAGQLALAAGRFDLVLCVEAAFLFESRRDFFDQARQLLRPGGWLVVSDLLFTTRAFGQELDWDWLVPAANRPLAAADYPELLRRCGLEPQRIEDATEACWLGFCRHLRRAATRAGAAADRHAFLDRLEASVSSYLLVAARAGAE